MSQTDVSHFLSLQTTGQQEGTNHSSKESRTLRSDYSKHNSLRDESPPNLTHLECSLSVQQMSLNNTHQAHKQDKSSQVIQVLRAVMVPNKKPLWAGVWLSGQEAHIPHWNA